MQDRTSKKLEMTEATSSAPWPESNPSAWMRDWALQRVTV
jgi:hypothetical protein